jgi:hypothetical protein
VREVHFPLCRTNPRAYSLLKFAIQFLGIPSTTRLFGIYPKMLRELLTVLPQLASVVVSHRVPSYLFHTLGGRLWAMKSSFCKAYLLVRICFQHDQSPCAPISHHLCFPSFRMQAAWSWAPRLKCSCRILLETQCQSL